MDNRTEVMMVEKHVNDTIVIEYESIPMELCMQDNNVTYEKRVPTYVRMHKRHIADFACKNCLHDEGESCEKDSTKNINKCTICFMSRNTLSNFQWMRTCLDIIPVSIVLHVTIIYEAK